MSKLVGITTKVQHTIIGQAKVKNLFVSCTWQTIRKGCDWKYVLGDLATSFSLSFLLLHEIMTRSFRQCFRICVLTWFTLFYMIKICCSTWAGTRMQHWSYCLIWCPHFGLFWKTRKTIPLPTEPLEKWRFRFGKQRYF